MSGRVLLALDTLAQMQADGASDDLIAGYLWALQDLGVNINDASEADALASMITAGLSETLR